jgi:hypothetical protein
MVKIGELRASNKYWEIETVPWASYTPDGEAWWTVRVAPDERPGVMWLAWNGERLARSTDAKQGIDRYPELMEKLPALLKGVFG